MSNKDNFGFYETSTQRFYSFFEGIYHCKSNEKISWNFNSETYDVLNWEQEPPVSLDELYRIRAQQLREKYDYLVLFLSGGADSSNILDTFINNDIKLDEVACLGDYQATGDTLSWLNAEIYHVVPEKLETARLKQPGIVHTVVDTVSIIQEMFKDPSAKFDWIYDINHFMNPYNASKRFLKMSQPHWANMINSGKRVCFIYGVDKPLVTAINEKYFFRFAGGGVNASVTPSIQRMNHSWEFDELFYWSPDLPELVVKQAHVIKNFLKLVPDNSPHLRAGQHAFSGSNKMANGTIKYLTLDMTHTLLYPGWYPVPHQHKPRSVIFSPRMDWIYKLPDTDPTKYSWRVGLDEIWKITPDIYKSNPADMSLGFKRMFSKPYYLGI